MIYLGCDHGGFDLKEKIKKWLKVWGYQWNDLGNTIYEKEDDYPRFAGIVAKRVTGEEELHGRKYPAPWKDRPKGILACRSAAGMVMAANRVKGIRATAVFDPAYAKMSRFHNDANILCLGADWLDELMIKKVIKAWLETEFSGEERHVRRIKMLEEI